MCGVGIGRSMAALPNPSLGGHVKPLKMLAALVAALAATLAISALPASAAASSAEIVGNNATLNLDPSDDNETVSVVGGVLAHTSVGGGLNSTTDWDSATPGDQTVPADGTFHIAVDGSDGNDSITVLAKSTEIADVFLIGGAGDDVLTGADTSDSLDGGDGNDRLVGAKGVDKMNGGAGNDTLVWNNGDGSDTLNGDAGNDGVEVNGAPTAGDVFTTDASAGRVQFHRTNLVPFTLDASAERFQVNGLGGNDSLSASDGVGALTLLSVDGGAGNDVLNGGSGDDRIVGDRGSDTMNGGAGDDTLVWNNGDGSDVVNGDDGSDDVEVNGAAAAGDIDTVQPNGSRIKFDRTNLVPFTLDIGTSETMHDNTLGGDDTVTVGDVGTYQVTASGDAGNDTVTGGPASETFLGGTGNDTINPGGGIYIVDAGAGDDQVNVRDKTADLARGGDGNDTVTADPGRLDILDGFENVDRTPDDVPPVVVPPVVVPPVGQDAPPAQVPGVSTLPVTIRGGVSKVKRNTASIKVSCPATSPGNCTGSLAVRTAAGARLAGLKAVLQLGSARYDIAAGSSKTVRVKLARGVQRLADRHGRLAVRAVASTGASGQIASSSKRLTLDLGTSSTKR